MARRFLGRPLGVAFILVWTLVPLYWVLNTGVPGGAKPKVERSLKFAAAGRLGPLVVLGEKSTSHRKP